MAILKKKFLVLLFILCGTHFLPAKDNSLHYHTLVIVKEENKYGLKDKDGKTILPIKYDNIEVSFIGKIPYYLVKIDNKYGIVDNNGNFFIKVAFDRIYTHNVTNTLVLQKDGLFGLANARGKIIVEPKYNYLDASGNRVIKFFKVKKTNDNWGLLNPNGKEILACNYLEIKSIDSCLFLVKNIDNLYGIWKGDSLNGNFLIDPSLNSIQNYSHEYNYFGESSEYNTFFLIEKNSLFGILDKKGDFVFQPQFKYINYYNKESEDKYVFYDDVKKMIFLIDANTQTVEPIFTKDTAYLFQNNHLLLIDSIGNYRLVNSIASITTRAFEKEGGTTCLRETYFVEYLPFKNHGHVFITTKSGKSGVINLKAEMIIDTIYDKLLYEGEGRNYDIDKIFCRDEMIDSSLYNNKYNEYQNLLNKINARIDVDINKSKRNIASDRFTHSENYYKAIIDSTSKIYYFFENARMIPDSLRIRYFLSKNIYAVKNTKSGKYLVINTSDFKIKSQEFDFIKDKLDCNKNAFVFKENIKCGIATMDSICIPANYQVIVPYSSIYLMRFNDYFALADSKFKILQDTCKFKMYYQTDSTHFIVKKNHSFEIMNSKGNSCSLAYDSIFNINNNKWEDIYIRSSGKQSQPIYWTKKDGKYGLIQSDGSIIKEPTFTEIYKHFNGDDSTIINYWTEYPNMCIVKKGNKFGVIDISGEYLAEPIYNNIHSIPIFLPFLKFANKEIQEQFNLDKNNIMINNYLCEFSDRYLPYDPYHNKYSIYSSYKNLFTINQTTIGVRDGAYKTHFYLMNSNEVYELSFEELLASDNTDSLASFIVNKVLNHISLHGAKYDYIYKEFYEEFLIAQKTITLNNILSFYPVILFTKEGLKFRTDPNSIFSNYSLSDNILVTYNELKPFVGKNGKLFPYVEE